MAFVASLGTAMSAGACQLVRLLLHAHERMCWLTNKRFLADCLLEQHAVTVVEHHHDENHQLPFAQYVGFTM